MCTTDRQALDYRRATAAPTTPRPLLSSQADQSTATSTSSTTTSITTAKRRRLRRVLLQLCALQTLLLYNKTMTSTRLPQSQFVYCRRTTSVQQNDDFHPDCSKVHLCTSGALLLHYKTMTSTPTAPRSMSVLQTYYFCTTKR